MIKKLWALALTSTLGVVTVSLLFVSMTLAQQGGMGPGPGTAHSAGSSGVPWITTFTVVSSSNFGADFCLGFKVTTDATPPTINAVGRYKISGNTGTHPVQVLDCTSALSSTLLGTGNVVMTGTPEADGFVYQTITPIALPPFSDVCFVSKETNGGDNYYDDTAAITGTNSGFGFTNSGSVFVVGSDCTVAESGHSPTPAIYVPINVKRQ